MIPQIILPYVFHQLNYHELLQCSLVCKLWYQLTFDPLLAEQWKDINFQQKIKKLTKRYVEDSINVTNRIKKEENMNWNEIFEKVLKRGKNHIKYLKLWSQFNPQQIHLVTNSHFTNNLILLDLRGTNFDIKFLFEINHKATINQKQQQQHITEKEIDIEDIKLKNNDNTKKVEINIKNGDNNKNDNNNDNNSINHTKDITVKKGEEKEKKKGKEEKEESEKKENENENENENEENYQYLLDLFKNLKYLYIYGCQNTTKEAIIKINEQWPHLTLDVKICNECQEMTRIGREKALNSDIQNIEAISHCHICKKSHCDHCRSLWTCATCGGEYICGDCRAHGLYCSTCDSDYCYTCNHPKKVLECRYCHKITCGQSVKCQNLGYLYQSCEKCHLYVCKACKNEHENLVVCSGRHCTKSYCKTCIHETSETSLISFDKADVEKRIHENSFGQCSYCNKLFCMDCINENISFYAGTKDFSCTLILCKDCETFYKTQLLNLFRIPSLSITNYSSNSNSTYGRDRIYSHHTNTSSVYPNHLLSIAPTNLITSRSLSIDSPIEIFNDDHYIR